MRLRLLLILLLATGCAPPGDASVDVVTPEWLDARRELLEAGPSARRTRLLRLLEQRLRTGTPEEKELILWRTQDYRIVDLLPAAIESLADTTTAPFHGDTGWGRTYRHAGYVIGFLAYTMDTAISRETYHSPEYSLLTGAVGDPHQTPGRVEELQRHWTRWWEGFMRRRIPPERAISRARGAARVGRRADVRLEETRDAWVVTLLGEGPRPPADGAAKAAVVSVDKWTGNVLEVSPGR
ncbi:MAG TPA: hypothetical protein VGR37_12855 [Longimicrobiaceae bacterium]|nr:hypothetical protein [Longimicrobiaceae bacterium]